MFVYKSPSSHCFLHLYQKKIRKLEEKENRESSMKREMEKGEILVEVEPWPELITTTASRDFAKVVTTVRHS